MYTAKRRGRSRCELFTASMLVERNTERALAADLERAMANDELELVYQPVISTQSGKLVGAEALLRWDHPTRGRLAPAQFLHLAIDSGAIVPIGNWVIERVCTDIEAWLAAGLVDGRFSAHVNVAQRQLVESSFVERVMSALRTHGLVPSQLMIDVDEATIGDTIGGSARTLQALRRSGVLIALDDFGIGVASLTALRHCGADVLKLDGTIARDLTGAGDDDPIVRSIVQLAHALDMQVVAEWVTSPDQLQRLRSLGCDLVQGFLLGEPTAADGFANRATVIVG
jgi:EAL domain-containing protein (putative c-di-GMP-specific phosphodiesterase class I)